MERARVKSSDLKSIGYDESNKILEIEFTRGEIYQYVNIPLNVYGELMAADSIGKYFNTYIRDQYQNAKSL